MLGVSPAHIPAGLREAVLEPSEMKMASEYSFVQVKLTEELSLSIQAGKPARLCGCKCYLPTLKLTAISLNHAFTVASEKLEVHRKARTANVFERAYLQRGDRWLSLDDVRQAAESRHAALVMGVAAG